ncbi:MAG: hypothetical protein QXR87_06265 [Candidatus Hadarchaeales archaeon]
MWRVGTGAGEEMLEVVRRARHTLSVVSPWISPSVASLLVKKAEEGVVTKVAMLNDRFNRGAFLRLTRVERRLRPPFLLAGGGLAAAGALAAGLGVLAGGLLGVLAGLVLMALGVKEERVPRVAALRLFPPGLHAKLVLADGRLLALGSSNLTVSGSRNLEAVAVLEVTPEEAFRIERIFWHAPEDGVPPP